MKTEIRLSLKNENLVFKYLAKYIINFLQGDVLIKQSASHQKVNPLFYPVSSSFKFCLKCLISN